MSESLYILIEENTIYDLNWIYCRRKIIAFTQILKNIWKIKFYSIIYNKIIDKQNKENEFLIYKGE